MPLNCGSGRWELKCPECKAENAEAKNFCAECGALLDLRFPSLVRSQVEGYIREHFRDRSLIEIEASERIATRLLRWAKLYYAFPAAALLVILALLGISDYSDFHKTVQRATEELGPKLDRALSEADSATKKAQDAQGRSDQAVNSIGSATAKMSAQLASAQELSSRVSALESQTASRMATASRHIEVRVAELDKRVETANRDIAAQQAKLTSTSELVTAMFSKGETETFMTTLGNTSRYVVNPGPGNSAAWVFMLLKNAPIYQTVQLGFHVFIQPKSSYLPQGNVLVFSWGESPQNLKQWPLEVSYVPDPTYHGPIYSMLTLKDGHVYADATQISP